MQLDILTHPKTGFCLTLYTGKNTQKTMGSTLIMIARTA